MPAGTKYGVSSHNLEICNSAKLYTIGQIYIHIFPCNILLIMCACYVYVKSIMCNFSQLRVFSVNSV